MLTSHTPDVHHHSRRDTSRSRANQPVGGCDGGLKKSGATGSEPFNVDLGFMLVAKKLGILRPKSCRAGARQPSW